MTPLKADRSAEPLRARRETTLVIIAKEPVAGRVKTRLHPALTFEQAAELAAASITDTLAAVADLPAGRRILSFEGLNVPAGAEGYDVIHQTDGTLDERLAAIFDECSGPTVLIGMDTPQLSVDHLAPAFDRWPDGVDAWFGPATDGGFWALGLAEPDGALIRGVPMSRDDTGRLQLGRLAAAGLGVRLLAPLTDVDTIHNAHDVAAIAPHTSFAATLAGFMAQRHQQRHQAQAQFHARAQLQTQTQTHSIPDAERLAS